MMARTHALSGAAAWMAAVPFIEGAVSLPFAPAEVAAGAVVTAGAALLPDLDHPKATISRALGPVSYILSRAVSAAAGGHRQATHSVLGVAVVAVLVWGIAAAGAEPVAGTVLAGLCVGLAIRAAGPQRMSRGGWVDVTLIAWTVVLTAAGVFAVDTMAWLPYAVTGGVVLHLVGDFLTPGGIPLLWPYRRRYGASVLRTDGWLEPVVAACLVVVIVMLGVPMVQSAG